MLYFPDKIKPLLAVATGWFLVLGIRISIPIVLPGIKETFSIGNTLAGITITTIWGGYAITQFPGGLLGDKFGERNIVTFSLIFGGISIIVLGLSPIYIVFLVGCAFYGLGTGFYGPLRGSVVSKIYSGTQKDNTAFGAMLASGSFGAVILPFLIGEASTFFGWRIALLISSIPLLLASFLVWNFIPPLSKTEHNKQPKQPSLKPIISSLVNKSVILWTIAATLMLFIYQGMTAFLPTYLITIKSMETSNATLLYSLFFASGAIFQIIGGVLADRFGDKIMLVSLTAIGSLSLILIPFTSGILLFAHAILLGVRSGAPPISNAYIIDVLPNSIQSSAWGFLRTTFFLIGSTGSFFVGGMADINLFNEAFLILGGLNFIATIIYAILPKRS